MDCYFDQIIYLQQIILLIEDEVARLKAIKEAYRVLKIGVPSFSFLNFDARIRSVKFAIFSISTPFEEVVIKLLNLISSWF